MVNTKLLTTLQLFLYNIFMQQLPKDRSNYCTLYIVRHGQTQWNLKRIVQGHTDSPLTSEGVMQARTLGKQFKNIDFAAAYSSDSLRAKRTAEIISLEKKLTIKTTEFLRERFLGKLEGKPFNNHINELKYVFEEYIDEQEKTLLEQLINKDLIKDVEPMENIIARFIPFIREIAITHIGDKVLVVSHGGVLLRFIKHLGYMKNPYIKNTGYIKILSDGVDFFVEEVQNIEESRFSS